MYWINVETQPGRGYPENYETEGGWFNTADRAAIPLAKIGESYGAPWEYNYNEVMKTEGGYS